MKSKKYRTFFLEEFAKELIKNSKRSIPETFPHHPVKQYIPEAVDIVDVSSLSPSPFLRYPSPKITMQIGETPQGTEKPRIKPMTVEIGNPREAQYTEQPQRITIRPQVQPGQFQPRFASISQQRYPIFQENQVTPIPKPLPPGFTLGNKLDSLIHNNKITSIECPGPGKFILVKIFGKVNMTKMSLGEEEIKSMIKSFSAATKIPFLSGVFKAAIGNLVITAVISDFVGSRFIINKYTPYSILEQNQQPQQMPFR